MSCSPEVLTRFAVEPGASPHTFDANSERIDVYGWTVRKRGTIIHPDTIIGTRSQKSERTRRGPYSIGGSFRMPVDVATMDLWLPRILGGNESTDTFPVAESLQTFGMLADLGGNTHEFEDCYVARAVFSGRAWNGQDSPDPIDLHVDVAGMDENTGTTFPAASLSTAANTAPLIFEEGVFTIQAEARTILAFRVEINNVLRVRWSNSLTATCIYPAGRIVSVSAIVPYTSDEATELYNQGYAGAAASLLFTNGNTSFGFTFGRLQIPPETPGVQGRGEVLLQLNGIARSVTTTKEIVGSNDSTV